MHQSELEGVPGFLGTVDVARKAGGRAATDNVAVTALGQESCCDTVGGADHVGVRSHESFANVTLVFRDASFVRPGEGQVPEAAVAGVVGVLDQRSVAFDGA